MAYKTPGVYVEEISIFPPSVAEVETAIPAFIGYTGKAEKKGEDLTNKPTKISSLLEFEQLFGGAFETTEVLVIVGDADNNYAVQEVTFPGEERYYLYDCMRLFFDNGGGDCYVISVGRYGDAVENGNASDPDNSPGLLVGLDRLKKYDEPTLILFPDAVLLSEASLFSLQQQALAQCAKLQDRFAIFDMPEVDQEWEEAVDSFRDGIGINNLKYGAAYTPWILTSYERDIDFNIFRDDVEDLNGDAVDLANLTSDSALNELVSTAVTAIDDREAIKANVVTWRTVSVTEKYPTLKDRYKAHKDAVKASDTATAGDPEDKFQTLIGFVRTLAQGMAGWRADRTGVNLLKDLDAYADAKLAETVKDLVAFEKNDDVQVLSGKSDANVESDYAAFDANTNWLDPYDTDDDGGALDDIAGTAVDYGDPAAAPKTVALATLPDVDEIFAGIYEFILDIQESAGTHAKMAQDVLYDRHAVIGNIARHIKMAFAAVPPSGAVAGLYAYVDDTRGVWKAPANVSISSVVGPIDKMDDNDQEDLNIDVNGGKSINAIRSFAGKGTLVWGARTLAGNDNEWRYIPVRRFFNMVEESVKKSTAWAVFEPNDAALWTRVKAMIDNYLVQKWQDGALQGDKPDEAFFVHVGLGLTMTPQDILEGRMIVKIGMAVVRPAEFIILQFSHKMLEAA